MKKKVAYMLFHGYHVAKLLSLRQHRLSSIGAGKKASHEETDGDEIPGSQAAYEQAAYTF